MAQWGTGDDHANSVSYAPQQFKVEANTANRQALFGNTTADAFVTGATIGQLGVDDSEITAGGGKEAHTGWVLRTVGSGGRSGRVQTEVLVAGGMSTDAEDVIYKDFVASILTQPLANTANTTAAAQATFTVSASTLPTGGTL